MPEKLQLINLQNQKKMKNNYHNKSQPKFEEIKDCIGSVSLYNEDSFVCEYDGCVYKVNNYFVTQIPDLYYYKSNRFEVKFSHLKLPITASVIERGDDGTGITIFELPRNKCKSLAPLSVETESEVKWGDNVYLPYHFHTDNIQKLSPLIVCPCDGSLFINGLVGGGHYGLPLLNSARKIIGIIDHACDLSQKDVADIQYAWEPVDDPIQKKKRLTEISSRNIYLATAVALCDVPCKYEHSNC